MLQQIQNADPTGEINPDSVDMLQLEGMYAENILLFLGEYQMSRLVGKPTMWFPNRSDKSRPVQALKRARSLKYRI